MTISAAIDFLSFAKTQKLFGELYGIDSHVFEKQKKRYRDLIEQFKNRFGDKDILIFSSPGRSEICGNHTDHNHGKVLAASIRLDSIAVIAAAEDGLVRICDSTYNENYHVDANDSCSPQGEKGSPALIRGIIEGFRNEGYKTGGFYGCFTSDVIPASGVSSSAAFEMLVCQVFNGLYNDGKIPIEKLARIGQYAENVWWKKGAGLLDQMACGIGGLVTIDFENPASPLVEKIIFDFNAQGYSLILVNTGGNHANLSDEYSSIPNEMKQVAKFFNKETLRGLSAQDIAKNLSAIRLVCGDRAVMRSFHFIEENKRVDSQIAALKANNFSAFLRMINESGNSSWKFLQNIYVSSDCERNQSVSVCLALTELFINCNNLAGKSASRIHGGGFAGVIQVFLPNEYVDAYKQWMRNALQTKDDPVFIMSIRPYGVIRVV